MKELKELIWGCTQMICGLLCILCGILLAALGIFWTPPVLYIGGLAGLIGLTLMANGFFTWVRPVLLQRYQCDNGSVGQENDA